MLILSKKHGCNIFKSFQINSQRLILNKFRFKEPANGQSLTGQLSRGKYQNDILKNLPKREFKVTISRHLTGFQLRSNTCHMTTISNCDLHEV